VYRTGDLGRYDADGKIEFLGRSDDQVKVRGYRIEPGEIEAVLNEHEAVKQSVVVVAEDERGDRRLIAYVVGGEWVTSPLLRIYLRDRLPDYMVPESIMVLEQMPVTANGKIDRKRLPRLSDARQSIEGSFVAPRDVLELQLAQIWESVLGIHSISVTDNFFDLGGHSLLAVRVMTKIRNVLGRDLPLSALFQGGTIERLAAMLRREHTSMSWSCLVELEPSGSRPPLFFVHPAGGNVLCYLDLARCLGPDQPFYGFQTPGLYGEQALYTRIEDLAAHYIEAMTAVQPEGPYFLGGWSIGGIIAYEMAQQLGARGERVGQLILLDTGAQLFGEGRTEEGDGHEDQFEEKDLIGLIKSFGDALPISREDLAQFQGDNQVDYVLKKAASLNLLPPDVDITLARCFLKVFRANGIARRKYVVQAYPGAITLFKTAMRLPMPSSVGSVDNEQNAELIQDPTLGWGELAAGGVRVVDVPGDHHTMVSRPQVETLALRMREFLIESETRVRVFDGESIESNSHPC